MSIATDVVAIVGAGAAAYGLHQWRSGVQADDQRDFDRADSNQREILDLERPSDLKVDIGVGRTIGATSAGAALVVGALGVHLAQDVVGNSPLSRGAKTTMLAGAAIIAATGVSILQNLVSD